MQYLSFCCFLQGGKNMQNSVFVKDENYIDLNPMQFGYETCKPDKSFGPAVRTHWIIHYVVSGQGLFKIGENTYNVKTGEMFVIPPFVETYYEADSENPWEYIWIGFTTKSDITKHLTDIMKYPEAEKIFNSMKKCENYTSGRSAYLCAQLWNLFALFSEGKDEKKDYVDTALEFIHSNYMEDITVEKIAKFLNLDRTYFSVIFRKQTGLSPKQYIIRHRMKIASSLLTKKNTEISVIANSVGYTDLYNFSKMFKRHFGISPTKYAKEKHTL